MTRNEYLNICLTDKEIYTKFNWYLATMQLPVDNFTENEYFKVIDGFYYVIINGNSFKLEDVTYERPIFKTDDVYTITDKEVENVEEVTTTTFGRIITNKILAASVFGNTIPFQDKSISAGSLEKQIAKLLQTDVVSVNQYKQFVNMAIFISNFSKIVTVSGTRKSLLPPAGLAKFKKELDEEFITKYGADWKENQVYVIEYEDRLRDFDSEWLADDEANGILNSGKVKNNARKRMYLTFGAEKGFDKGDTEPTMIDGSLLDGYPKDKEQLAVMINNSRAGSYSRGGETQKGGLAAKILLRATNAISIIDNDCGSVLGKEYLVTEDNHESLYKRYMIVKNESILIEDTKKLIGKTITVRSPMYCKQDNGNICSKCTGDVVSKYDKGVSLMVTDISSIILYSSMKAVHSKQLKTMSLKIEDIIF